MHIKHIWTFTKFFLKGKTRSITDTADTLLLSPLHQLSKPAAENTFWLLTISCLQHRGLFSSLPFSDTPRACTGLQLGSQQRKCTEEVLTLQGAALNQCVWRERRWGWWEHYFECLSSKLHLKIHSENWSLQNSKSNQFIMALLNLGLQGPLLIIRAR